MITGCGAASDSAAGVLPSEVASASLADSNYWEKGSVSWDVTDWVECRGEDVHATGEQFYRFHRTDTANGWSIEMFWEPATPNQPFTAVGVTSGTVFRVVGSPSPDVRHISFATGEEGRTRTIVENHKYMAASGEWFKISWFRHVTLTPSGQFFVTDTGFVYTCQ